MPRGEGFLCPYVPSHRDKGVDGRDKVWADISSEVGAYWLNLSFILPLHFRPHLLLLLLLIQFLQVFLKIFLRLEAQSVIC